MESRSARGSVMLRAGTRLTSCGNGCSLTRSCWAADRYDPTSFRMSRSSIHAVDCALNHRRASK